MADDPIRLIIVDDHPIVLAGLKALVQANPGFCIVGEAMDGVTALRVARETRPDVAMLDISLPEMSGLDVTRALQATLPACRILMLTVYEDQAYLRQSLKLGAAGYLLKRSAPEELIRAIRAVAQGGIYLDPNIAGKLLGDAPRGPPETEPVSGVELSQREADVVRLLAAGHTNKEMASKLAISIKTVETYKIRAMEKLGCRTRVEIVRYAAAKGWLHDSGADSRSARSPVLLADGVSGKA